MSGPLRWVISYMRRYPIRSLFTTISAAVEPILYMIPLFISADIVGVLLAGGKWADVLDLYLLIIPLAIFQVIFFFSTSFVNEILAHRITTDMTYDLFSTLQDKSLSYHDGKDTGDIMARATNDTRSVNMALSPGIRMIQALFTVWGVGFYAMWGVSPWLVVLGLVTLVIFFYATMIYGRVVEPLSTQALGELSLLSSVTTDSVAGVRDIKVYAANPLFKRKFLKQAYKEARVREREGVLGAWFWPNLIARAYIIGLLAYVLYMTSIGQISIPLMVLIVTIASVMLGMAEEMVWIAFVSVGGYAATKRLMNFINEQDIAPPVSGNTVYNDQPARIEFDNVSFSYKNGEKVLDNLSFAIEDSETLAIVGSPGSGKSTLTKLIQRLYLPDEGTIRLGGNNLQDYDEISLRSNMATVEQDIFLFNDTIMENIRFGQPQASQEEVEMAASIAQAHDFIISFPEGYDTLIGDNGVRLSGGQQQRLAIARALLINPKILIIDDGASALDARTEAQIQNAISAILQTKTTIITTHRLAIIAQADKILILDKGKIMGYGSHEVLIQSNDYYRQLFENHFELPPLLEGLS